MLRHEVVCLNNPFNILAMDANSDAHDHLLRSLSYLTIDSEQVGSFESLKPKLQFFGISVLVYLNKGNLQIVVKIAVVDDGGIEQFGVVTNYLICLLRYHQLRTWLPPSQGHSLVGLKRPHDSFNASYV